MDDLRGTAEERAEQLARLEDEDSPSPEWIRRQLGLVLEAWGRDEDVLDVEAEARQDY